jgi:hypothetical protein
MICEIHDCGSWEITLSYLESKLEAPEKAIRFGENLFLDTDQLSFRSISQELKATLNLNNRVNKENQIFHASINFDVTDKPTDMQLEEITKAYISRMGYTNSPYVTYKHTDKAHMHIHIFASNVDFDSRVVDRFNNFRRSQQFSRATEKKYNLFNVKYEKQMKSSSRFINSSRYAFDKAIRRTIKNDKLTEGLSSVLNYFDFDKILESPQNNDFYKAFFGAEAFFSAIDFFKKYELYQDPLKKQLISRLSHTREKSTDGKDFMSNLKKQGIYVRRIYSDGKPTFIYGFKDLFVNEDKLPVEFSFKNLFTYNEDPFRNYDKKNLASKVIQILRQSKDLDGFKSNLEKSGIELVTHENSGGIYGVSFKAKIEGQVSIFKGSELSKQHLTWNRIKEHFTNEFSTIQPKIQDYNANFISQVSYKIGMVNSKAAVYSKGYNNFSSDSSDFAPELLSKKRRRKDLDRE